MAVIMNEEEAYQMRLAVFGRASGQSPDQEEGLYDGQSFYTSSESPTEACGGSSRSSRISDVQSEYSGVAMPINQGEAPLDIFLNNIPRILYNSQSDTSQASTMDLSSCSGSSGLISDEECFPIYGDSEK